MFVENDSDGCPLSNPRYPDVAVLRCHSSLAAFPLIDGNSITKTGANGDTDKILGQMGMQALFERKPQNLFENCDEI